MKSYILEPTMTFETVANASAAFKPLDKESAAIAEVIAPARQTQIRHRGHTTPQAPRKFTGFELAVNAG
ncbi:MAG: hypothetical protein H7Y43_04470 [Akkermansiaceae bacterium]|nr:hypothetical protein [Verrucomicrobiales bacterium]